MLAIQKCSVKSQQVNTAVNTFMELEKLKLSCKKCSKIHVGKPNVNCHIAKVHNEDMKEVESEVYLGDKIHKSGKLGLNISYRKAKGFGIVNEILAMIKEAPLSWWKIKAGLILRQARLVNGMIFNSEAWHGLSIKQTQCQQCSL